MTAPRVVLEKDIQRVILDYLRWKKHYVRRLNVGMIPARNGAWRASTMRGMSDLIGVLVPSGRFLAIEVKAPGAPTTPEQADFIARVNAAGGLAFVATCLEDVSTRIP